MPKPRANAAPAAPRAPTRAPIALWCVLAALVAARAVLAFTPGMTLWSLNLMRFMTPALAWGLWALAALALVPPLAARAVPAFAHAGDGLALTPARAGIICAMLGALVVWLTPDHVRFVGDFLLRQGTVEAAERPGLLF